MDTFQSSQFSEPPLCPEIVPERHAPQPPRKSGTFGKLVFILALLALLGSVGFNILLLGALAVGGISGDDDGRVQEKYFSLNRHGSDKVAILSIEGTILSGEGFFRQQINRARKDAKDGKLKAIVVRVNSPGGTISGSDYMLHHLRDLARETRIPLVVSMGGMAASGGYYVSMCVGDTPNTIFAEPSTWTGSIGVLIPHYNIADLMTKWGIQEDAIASHPLKTMGSMARKMTPAEREIFQSLVNDGFTQFKDAIKGGRPKYSQDPEALDKLATGQIFTAAQALENGLIDKIGFVENAIDRAIELAHLNKSNVKVVKYKEESSFSEILFGGSSARATLDLGMLLDATSPRAYFLCTWLPVLASSKE